MRVFIAWSDEPSRSIAKALHDWLQGVVQRVEPWMSDNNIDGGARWNKAIAKALEDTDFGIVCVTRANQTAPWLNFEAGAVAKKVEEGRVVPLLIDLPPTDLEGPLTAFQWRLLNEQDVRRLVHDLNKAAEEHVPEKALDGLFDVMWPTLKADIDAAVEGAASAQAEPVRSTKDMLVELVETLRRMDRSLETGLMKAYERALRLDEFSTPLDPQAGRPFVVTTGSPMSPRPQEIHAAMKNETRAASKVPE